MCDHCVAISEGHDAVCRRLSPTPAPGPSPACLPHTHRTLTDGYNRLSSLLMCCSTVNSTCSNYRNNLLIELWQEGHGAVWLIWACLGKEVHPNKAQYCLHCLLQTPKGHPLMAFLIPYYHTLKWKMNTFFSKLNVRQGINPWGQVAQSNCVSLLRDVVAAVLPEGLSRSAGPIACLLLTRSSMTEFNSKVQVFLPCVSQGQPNFTTFHKKCQTLTRLIMKKLLAIFVLQNCWSSKYHT